jgi:hypothetical protein
VYADRDAVHHLSIGRFAGPLRESHLVDERETDEPQRYVTEIT